MTCHSLTYYLRYLQTTIKTKALMPPLSVFLREDLYLRKMENSSPSCQHFLGGVTKGVSSVIAFYFYRLNSPGYNKNNGNK